jgi:hypothetical protein
LLTVPLPDAAASVEANSNIIRRNVPDTSANKSLSHEFLALVLVVRRAGVINELHILEGVHPIKATRGKVRITDQSKLIAGTWPQVVFILSSASEVGGLVTHVRLHTCIARRDTMHGRRQRYLY